MRPSTLIFIGASGFITSLMIQLMVALLAARHAETLPQMETSAEDKTDALLLQLHGNNLAAFVGDTFAQFLMIVSLILILIGVYFTARTVEKLAAAKTPD